MTFHEELLEEGLKSWATNYPASWDFFDFGAMIRAFTHSGCDGNRTPRSPHSPFFFRIQFKTIAATAWRRLN
jgi:hypothetical protein